VCTHWVQPDFIHPLLRMWEGRGPTYDAVLAHNIANSEFTHQIFLHVAEQPPRCGENNFGPRLLNNAAEPVQHSLVDLKRRSTLGHDCHGIQDPINVQEYTLQACTLIPSFLHCHCRREGWLVHLDLHHSPNSAWQWHSFRLPSLRDSKILLYSYLL
jgi:hypothetical protein